MGVDSSNGIEMRWDNITDEGQLLAAYVRAELKVISEFSGDIRGDARKLKAWFDNYVKYSDCLGTTPLIDWETYIGED